MNRKLAALAAAFMLSASAAQAETFTFVALGDMPYRLPDDYPRFERLIGVINRTAPAFSIHVGDIKSGGTSCADDALMKIKGYFDSFEQPLVYTPGDNEWTDCHRKAAGGFDPLERLAKVRQIFFPAAETLGKVHFSVSRQSDGTPGGLIENVRFEHAGVVFATLNIVGSNNGFERTIESATEFFARDKANSAWIAETFKFAIEGNAKAVVLAFQADPGWDADGYLPKKHKARGGEDGFKNSVMAMAVGAEAFRKPVLLIQGDTHTFIVDQPLMSADDKAPLFNVTRLQVMGETLVHAVRVTVDTEDPGVFGFRPLIVPENIETAKAE